jgi:hypothetical protein
MKAAKFKMFRHRRLWHNISSNGCSLVVSALEVPKINPMADTMPTQPRGCGDSTVWAIGIDLLLAHIILSIWLGGSSANLVEGSLKLLSSSEHDMRQAGYWTVTGCNPVWPGRVSIHNARQVGWFWHKFVSSHNHGVSSGFSSLLLSLCDSPCKKASMRLTWMVLMT